MLISHSWLKELTGTKLDPQEVRERLTNVGLAVDAVAERDGDSILDVEVASNRPDCLSHVGVARELAAIQQSQVSSSEFRVPKTKGRAGEFASVEISDPDFCPRYAARIIRGVKIAPSPAWLAKRLEALGQRPINNVADITNYVLHEFGQPLHAFDLAKLTDRKIIVRRASNGELIKTLDGAERKLDGEMLVIADAKRAVAVAGVMGGEETEISNSTTDVLIESAYFHPASVRRTAKLLGLHTEASHRFERGTDPEGVLQAQERCVALICKIAGGEATEDAIDIYPKRIRQRTATLRPERVEALTGLHVETKAMLRILGALGFVLNAGESHQLTFAIPSWRHDVAIEEDLIEEVARHTGYDQIKTELPPASLAGEYQATENRKRALRRALSSNGFDEAINLSFIELTDQFELIPHFAACSSDNQVVLTNPIIEEASRMRPTLLHGLLTSVRHNLNHSIRDVSLFEIGRIFEVFKPGELPEEREALALAATGGSLAANRAEPERELDFSDFKGALESAIEALNLPPLEYEAATIRHLRAGQSAAVSFKGKRVGSIGLLAEPVAAEYKLRPAVFVAEIDLGELLAAKELPIRYSPLPRYPSVVRDVSLLLDRKTALAKLLKAVTESKDGKCLGAKFVGSYEGEGIPAGKRSVTLRFEYRADDHTLRDEEVDEIHWPLVKTLQAKFSAELR